MEPPTSPLKNARSPGTDAAVNVKTSITCSNVPEGLFDANAAKKHFSKFGRVQKIRLFPRRQMCIIEYDQPNSVERAVLNAGAFDGFMFDVTRIKPKMRRRSKRDDDPDWTPNSEVEAELSAMGGTPTYRVPRQKPMETESEAVRKPSRITRVVKQNLPNAKAVVREKIVGMSQSAITNEPVVAVTALPTSISTAEAVADLHQLRSRVSFTPDEQWRTLDARDKILRSWGGAGSRIKVGGATIGTCPDMCPEKELLHRQAEHQVMTLETVQDSDGQLDPWRAVKQYSRSSADQEMPMCYELRPPRVLMQTCAYLLHEIADTRRQVSLADWFHFMWDRFRGIRKDITQQALCCADSIQLVEMCARFHAHCAARLADLEHTQFDQKLNTDNLTKCLQTLKHMYTDVEPDFKPREAEFRGYIALLNLGDANFWWEIKQLSLEIQKSEPISFATQIFMALDNNNYIRFFRLIRDKATYLQACILLRYFNDVRARALARIVKAFAPRGGSRYPAYELMNALAFESTDNMQSFISHYGLRIGKEIDCEVAVILDRNQFIEDSDPYPISRSVQLIESKRQCTVGEVIAGGQLPQADYLNHTLYSSFGKDGKLKETALIAEDLGYDTKNDSNKDIKALMTEVQRLAQSGKHYSNTEREIPKTHTFSKPDSKPILPDKPLQMFSIPNNAVNGNTYSFKPAIPIAPREIISNSPEKVFEVNVKNTFSFSKPQASPAIPTFSEPGNIFKTGIGKGFFDAKNASENKSIFGKSRDENMDPMQNTQNIFKSVNTDQPSFSKKPDAAKTIFGQIQTSNDAQSFLGPNKNIFSRKDDDKAGTQNVFGNKSNLFGKSANVNEKEGNIFTKPALNQEMKSDTNPSNLFRTFNKPETNFDSNNIFAKSQNSDNQTNIKSIFASNGEVKPTTSPGSLFKTANNLSGESAKLSLITTTNKLPSEEQNIFSAFKPSVSKSVYDFEENNDDESNTLVEERVRKEEEKLEKLRKEKEFIENLKRQEELKKQEIKIQEELKKKEEERLKQEEIRKQEEQRRLKEKRKEDERRQEQLKKKLEEERKAELKKKAEEELKRFQERVDKESEELVTELVEEIQSQTLSDLLKEEIDHLRKFVLYANEINQEILTELCDEICEMEVKAETFWSHKLMKKWFHTWKKQLDRNIKRRTLLEDTPVWLTDKTPVEEALLLRRAVENTALKNMNAIHRGYKFTGELKQIAPPDKYNIMELIKSPLLKRMKQINYAYDKCFFWKATIALPSSAKWLYRKVNMEEWINKAFSDRKTHEASDTLIQVGRQSWNNLMDFAISVSFIKESNRHECSEAMDGTNGLLIYATEIEDELINTIKEILRTKYPYQKVPVAVVMPQLQNTSTHLMLEKVLTEFVNNGTISTFKLFTVQHQNISESLNCCTKSALKWLARKYPECPPLQIDYLKSICQRYLGNEIWCMLRSHTHCRMIKVMKDLQKIVNCYNAAVDKLVQILTDEDLFNYPSFPLEFKPYINDMSPYPKPYEFIPSSVKSSENTNAIKEFMNKLKLPIPREKFNPTNVICMQDGIREYCNHIGWFEDPEEVACKVVALLPQELSDISMPHEEFTKSFEHYNLIDFLNIIVYEKIRDLNNFGNRFAIYKTSVLEDYRNDNWLNDIEELSNMKHKAIECEDEIDSFIEAKRRKIAHDSLEYLMIEDKDQTMIDENIKVTNESIASFNNCEEAVKQLEDQLDEGKKKSAELEKLLRAALSNV